MRCFFFDEFIFFPPLLFQISRGVFCGMASDAQLYDEELRSVEMQIQGILDKSSTLPVNSRREQFTKVEKLLKTANQRLHDLGNAVRSLDGSERNTYAAKSEEHTKTIKSLKDDLMRRKKDLSAPPAPGGGYTSPTLDNGGAADSGYGNNGHRGDGKDEARDATGRINHIQNKTINTLNDAERTLAQTEETGDQAVVNLKSQTDQINRINDNLDVLDSEVEQAKKELNAFIRRLMTDRIILCFGFLVLIGIVLLVVFNFVIKKKDNTSASDATPPPATTTAPPTTTAGP